MAWTETTREHYRRDGLRYASDLTDAEFAVIEALLPGRSSRGRPRTTPLRAVVEAILYIAHAACPWRLLPTDFPPFTTVQYYFYRWRDDGTWPRINQALVAHAREVAGRKAQPTACLIDSQSVRTTEAGGPRGYAAEKMVRGRKRHLLTDTQGHLLTAVVHPANIQDRDGASLVMDAARKTYTDLSLIVADAAYAGPKLRAALTTIGTWTIEIVKRSDAAKGFELLPKRWVIERTIAWLNRSRRLAKDFEASTESACAWLFIASIKLLVRRIARATQPA
jgi:transposase